MTLSSPDAAEGTPRKAAVALPARRALRVISGAHAGAQIELQQERVLVGNIESECDLVLDVTRPERHACLLRTSEDGWTVLAIAGDLWVGGNFVELARTADIRPTDVITLGRVAFCVADPDTTDWTRIRPPVDLVRPTAAGGEPRAAIPAPRPQALRRWNGLRLASGIGLGITLCLASLSYVKDALQFAPVPADAVAKARSNASEALAALPAAREVRVSEHPDRPGHVVLHGYVPSQAVLDDVLARLKGLGIQADSRLARVDGLRTDLLRRIEGVSEADVRYEGQGRFTVRTRIGEVEAHDRQAKAMLQEVPALEAVRLTVDDAADDAGQPYTLAYSRVPGRPGDITSTPIDTVLGRRVYQLREVRLGAFPSVVMENGQRYFTGAKLPNGAIVQKIEPERVVIARPGGAEVAIPLPHRVLAAAAAAAPTPANRTGRTTTAAAPATAKATSNSNSTATATAAPAQAQAQAPSSGQNPRSPREAAAPPLATAQKTPSRPDRASATWVMSGP